MTIALFERLKAACPDAWRAYTRHSFVEGMAGGGLPAAAFRHYLGQDYLFLIQFARAYALAGYKAKTLDDLRRAKDGIVAILDVELGLHIGCCENWGIGRADLDALEEDTPCMAYTRYVLERGMAGDLLDLHAALAPCMLGYGEIGRRLGTDPAATSSENPYSAWVAMYAGAEYQAACAEETAYLDRLAGDLSARRFGEIARTFADATRLEVDFWQMGLDAAG